MSIAPCPGQGLGYELFGRKVVGREVADRLTVAELAARCFEQLLKMRSDQSLKCVMVGSQTLPPPFLIRGRRRIKAAWLRGCGVFPFSAAHLYFARKTHRLLPP